MRHRTLLLLGVLDVAAMAVGFYLLRPRVVCSGMDPHCELLNPGHFLPRFLVLLVGGLIALVLVLLASTREG